MSVRRTTARLARGVAAASLVAAGSLVSPPSASAVTCLSAAYWTSTNPSASSTFVIGANSDCVDLNASSARTASDRVKGWYRTSSGSWVGGNRGFVFVPKVENGWKVLLTNVVNGTTVKGQTAWLSQNVQYVF